MRLKITLSILLILALPLVSGGMAYGISDPIVFPKEGQSKVRQGQDKQSCKEWAQGETGVDPSYLRAKIEMTNDNVANAASSGEPKFGRNLLRGAALGAAMGGIDDGIDNDIGKRAVQGVVLSGSRTRQDKKNYQREQELNYQLQKKGSLEKKYDEYMRAFSVCMDAKGYSVR